MNPAAKDALTDPHNDVFVSSVAAWEMVIKHALGKLALPSSPAVYLSRRLRTLGYRELPFTLQHALAVADLPSIHADPFDRAMIAQAHCEGMTFLTADPANLQYAVKLLDARG